MKYTTHLLFVACVSALSACSPSSAPDAMSDDSHGDHQTSIEEDKPELFVEDRSTGTELAFAVLQGGKIITDFGVSHEKEMHLIVARDDLKYFRHLHPERDVDGMWHVPFTPEAPGRYWIYADFVDAENRPYTLRFSKTVPGEIGDYGFVRDERREKSFEGINVAFESVAVEGGTELRYMLRDDAGNPIVLEDYLGAKGHSVLLSSVNGAYVHTHPMDGERTLPAGRQARGDVTFFVPAERDPAYRVFTQFQVAGEVITTVFDW